jgi:hypothetical protein
VVSRNDSPHSSRSVRPSAHEMQRIELARASKQPHRPEFPAHPSPTLNAFSFRAEIIPEKNWYRLGGYGLPRVEVAPERLSNSAAVYVANTRNNFAVTSEFCPYPVAPGRLSGGRSPGSPIWRQCSGRLRLGRKFTSPVTAAGSNGRCNTI